jgi:hypothetical protein
MEYIDPQHQPERRSIWEPEYEAPKPVVDEWGQPIDPYAPKIELPDTGDDGKPLWHRLNNLPDIKPSPAGKEKDPNAPEPLWGNIPPEADPQSSDEIEYKKAEPLWGNKPPETDSQPNSRKEPLGMIRFRPSRMRRLMWRELVLGRRGMVRWMRVPCWIGCFHVGGMGLNLTTLGCLMGRR